MDDKTPLVYVVILNWNGCEVLRETLETVAKLDYPNYKILVVDNGSTDGSLDIARQKFSFIEIIENRENLGFGEGNNVGIRYALQHGAEWILLLNNDIIADRDLLKELMIAAMSDTRIGALAPKIYYFANPKSLWYAGGKISFWTGNVSHRGLREEDRGQFDTQEDTEYLTGCAFLVRREVLERVGLFDKIYFPAYSEDVDLTERIRRAGYRLVYVPSAKLWHKVSSSSGGGLTTFKTQLKVEHNLIFFKRYARWYHWLVIPWCVGAKTMVFIFREIAKGNFKIIVALLKGFVKALRPVAA